MISLQGVCKSYEGSLFSVRSLDLEISRGETLALVGGSGSGKTTTLKMINRLVEPDSGAIHVDGRDIEDRSPPELRRTIGYVFQEVGLFPHFSVACNVGVVLRLLGRARNEIRSRVDKMLELVRLDPKEYRERYPRELSGGQQQRVGLARALAAESPVLLMDEPFGALDPVTRDALREEFRTLRDTLGLTTVLVTHDMAEALLLADRVAVLADGELLRVGAPSELIADPRSDFVRDLVEMPLREAHRLEQLASADGGGAPVG